MESLSRRHFLRACLRLAGLGLLVGCAPAPPAGVGRREPAGRGGERRAPAQQSSPAAAISWSFWGDPWQVEVTRRVARVFESENPSIKLELLHKPWGEYFTWLDEQWRRGTVPDVMFLNYIPARVPSGLLEPLDLYIARDRFDLGDFYPRLLEQFQHAGSYYGLPRDNDTKVIYYNKTLFAEAGLDPPKPGWTWAELRSLAAGLTKRDAGRGEQYGFAFEAATWWILFVWQNGGDLTDDPFRPTCVLLGEPAAIEAIQFLGDLVNVDRCTPAPEVLLSTDRIRDLFRGGKLAMALGNHGLVPAFVEADGLSWDIVGLPAGRVRSNFAGGAGYTISATSQRKDTAWALVRFLEGPIGQALFAESGVITPARRSVREDNLFLRQEAYDARVWGEETQRGRPALNAPAREEVVALVEPALTAVWRGERSAAEAVGAILPDLRRLLER